MKRDEEDIADEWARLERTGMYVGMILAAIWLASWLIVWIVAP